MAKGGRGRSPSHTLLQMLSLPLEDPRERSRFIALQKPSSRVLLPDQTGNLKIKGETGREEKQGGGEAWVMEEEMGTGSRKDTVAHLPDNQWFRLPIRARQRPLIIQNTEFCRLTY